GGPMRVRVACGPTAAGADPVGAVGGDGDGLAAVGLTTIADERAGAGPLAGIAAALADPGAADVVVVLACDLLGVSPVGVRAVVDALEADPTARAAVPVVAGRPQPLHAAWRREALPAVEAALAEDRRAVWALLGELGA